MEIERVNDYTIKLYISYRDIEERGFNREEIWYNRERGEELFWEMMDEANEHDDFEMDGPLWIQVQAFDKGLEIVVTKAQFTQDGARLELPISDSKHIEIPYDSNREGSFDHPLIENSEINGWKDNEKVTRRTQIDKSSSYLIKFTDFEDVISLTHRLHSIPFRNDLYVMDDVYYLHTLFTNDNSDARKENIVSQLLEYGSFTRITIHRLQEYGKLLISQSALEQIREHFPN